MFLDRVPKEALGSHFEELTPNSTQQWEREIFLRLLTNRTGWKVLVAWPSLGSELQIIANQLGSTGELVIVDSDAATLAQLKANNEKGIYTTRTTKNLEGNAVYKRDVKIRSAVQIEAFDGDSLNFENDTFDAAWCASHNRPASEGPHRKLIEEFYRVVRPSGYVVISQLPIKTA